jgi:hypothetical protein
MADGDAAAVDVQLFRVDAQCALAIDRLVGKGFVDFPQADVVDLQA